MSIKSYIWWSVFTISIVFSMLPVRARETLLIAIILNDEGIIALNHSQWNLAIDKLQAATIADPHYALARQNLSCVHNNYGLSLVKQDNRQAFRQFQLAAFYAQGPNVLTNLREMTKRIGKDPDSSSDHTNLGDVAKVNGDLRNAVVEYKFALQTSENALVRKKLDETQRLLDKQEEFSRRKFISKNNWIPLIQRAQSDISENKYSSAEKTIREAIRCCNEPSSVRQGLFEMLMQCESSAGDLTALQATRQEFVTQFPNSKHTKVVKEIFELSKEDFKTIQNRESGTAQILPSRIESVPINIYFALDDKVKLPVRLYTKAVLTKYSKLARRAIADWASHSNGQLKFVIVEKPDDADISCIWTSDMTKRKYSYTAGETNTYYDSHRNRKIRSALIFLDQQRVITDDEFFVVCLHELGHALGLMHTSHPEDIMYGGGDLFSNSTSKKVLSKGDIRQLQSIYSDSEFAKFAENFGKEALLDRHYTGAYDALSARLQQNTTLAQFKDQIKSDFREASPTELEVLRVENWSTHSVVALRARNKSDFYYYYLRVVRSSNGALKIEEFRRVPTTNSQTALLNVH